MGILDRLILTDTQWSRISEHIIGDERTRGSSGHNNRMFVEGVLWIVRTGAPWRDLPEVFGSWNSAFRPLQPVERQRRLASHFHRDGG
jgi:transposase